MGQTGKRVGRLRGPVGLGAKSKHQKTSRFIPGGARSAGEGRLVAKIYFPVGGRALDSNDKQVLKQLTNHYLTLLLGGQKVRLSFIGRADPRYYEDFNQDLSEKRAAAVAAEVAKILGGFGNYRTRIRGTGERVVSGSRTEDRRVDVIDASPAARVADIKVRLRKAAEQALRRHEEAIRNLQRQVSKYQERLDRGPNWAYYYNLVDVDYHTRRLERYKSRYGALLKAITDGDEAFHAWMRTKRAPALEDARKDLERSEKLREQLTEEMRTAPPEQKAYLKNALEFVDTDIATIRDEIKSLEDSPRHAAAGK